MGEARKGNRDICTIGNVRRIKIRAPERPDSAQPTGWSCPKLCARCLEPVEEPAILYEDWFIDKSATYLGKENVPYCKACGTKMNHLATATYIVLITLGIIGMAVGMYY